MRKEIAQAIYSRWNAAALNSSISALYAGNEIASPERTSLPRAQYRMDFDAVELRSRMHRVHVQPVQFSVWADDDLECRTKIDLVETAFVNSESASSSPIAISTTVGRIIAVDYIGKTVIREDDAVYQGILNIEITWHLNDVSP